MGDGIQLFEDKRIRMVWNEEREEWLFSIVDVVGVLTEQPTQRGAAAKWPERRAENNRGRHWQACCHSAKRHRV